MKKSRLLLIPLVALAASAGIMLSNTEMTEAANNPVCSAEDFRDNYLSKINIRYDGNRIILQNGSGLDLTYRFIPDGNTSNPQTGDLRKDLQAEFTVSEGGLVYFYLKSDLKEPCTASSGMEIGKMELNADAGTDNSVYYSTACAEYRRKWAGNEMMENAVPTCFAPRSFTQYSLGQVQEWIAIAERLQADISKPPTSNITIDDSYEEVADTDLHKHLTCDAFSNNNYETMHKYYHVETETEGDCEVTCKEEIEVNFSDPVATQAGLCFQYLIEIKSKVVCDASYKAEPPERKEVCYPTPVCYSGAASYDAGGPNEDFDQCVKQCDNGKYTQKCIDSCYSKVYENKSTKNTNKKVSNDGTFTREEFETLSPFYVPTETFYEARQMAVNCSWSTAEQLYNLRQHDPGGYYNGGSWIQSGSCPSALGPYYFRSVAATQKTINMMNGTYSYSGGRNGYNPDGNGILRENYGGYYCSDSCSWVGSCGSDTVLTEGQAQAQYQQDLAEYYAAKAACEQKAATCTNERTDYEIVVDNPDTNPNNGNDKETFNSYQNLNSNKVQGSFPDMVTLTSGECEGNNDGWHYHNIITFPGTWINNKTGQTVHSMDPGYEDFYTYVGNEYCTKLNSVPINTAWYDWKVNQNGDSSALTDDEKSEIEANIEMNIHGSIENYGYFGWDFDISCFYAIGEPETSCTPDDPDYPNCDDPDPNCDPTDPDYPNCNDGGNDDTDPGVPESPVNSYDFRPVALDNLFPNSTTPTSSSEKDIQASNLINTVESLRNNSATTVADAEREIGFNWTCAATNLENPDYIVQPVTVLNQIQALGDSIYEGDEYLDYHIRLTPETMNKVRNYNDQYDSYAEPTSNKSSEVLNAGSNKTAGITVYRSYLLHKVLNKGTELVKSGVIGCNNEDNGSCPNTIDTSTSCYQEYMAQSAVLKGAK